MENFIFTKKVSREDEDMLNAFGFLKASPERQLKRKKRRDAKGMELMEMDSIKTKSIPKVTNPFTTKEMKKRVVAPTDTTKEGVVENKATKMPQEMIDRQKIIGIPSKTFKIVGFSIVGLAVVGVVFKIVKNKRAKK